MFDKLADKFYGLLKQGAVAILIGSLVVVLFSWIFKLTGAMVLGLMFAFGSIFALGYISAREVDRAKARKQAGQEYSRERRRRTPTPRSARNR